MAERRALLEGLQNLEDVDPDLAEEFIATGKPRQATRAAAADPEPRSRDADQSPAPPLPPRSAIAEAPVASPLTGIGRVPVGARVRTELAAALKRASLERQLQGVQPNSVQDILENALELWLHKHGLLR